MDPSNSILVLCSRTVDGAKIFRCLTRAGHNTIGHGPSKSASSYSRHCTKYIESQNLENDTRNINNLINNKTVCNVIASDDWSSDALRRIRQNATDYYNIFLAPSDQQYVIADDKLAFYNWCRLNDFTSPKTQNAAIYTGDQLLPAVLKRRSGRGGTGYKLLLTREDAEIATHQISNSDAWIIQEYIEGVDIAVNVVCKNGEILSYFTQQCIAQRNRFGPQIITKISNKPSKYLDLAGKVFERLNWNGPAVLDMREEKGTVHLLEINSRFGRAVQAGLGIGVNLPATLVDSAKQGPHKITKEREFVYPSELFQDPRLLFSIKFLRGHRFSSIWLTASDPGPFIAGRFSRVNNTEPIAISAQDLRVRAEQ